MCHEGMDKSNDLEKKCLFQTYEQSMKCVGEKVTLQSVRMFRFINYLKEMLLVRNKRCVLE